MRVAIGDAGAIAAATARSTAPADRIGWVTVGNAGTATTTPAYGIIRVAIGDLRFRRRGATDDGDGAQCGASDDPAQE